MIQRKDLYSVYTHTSPSGKVYVGVSNNPKRRWGTKGGPYLFKNKDGNYFQSCFAKAIIKYGWDNFEHKIILENISANEALYAEKYLIRWYKIHHKSYNMSDGGEYYSGSRGPLSEERRLKVKAFMNAHHPMKGRHHTLEARAKMAEAARNRNYSVEKRKAISEKRSKARLGITFSEKTRSKLQQNWKENHKNITAHNKKEIHQYDFNGVYITSYPSVAEAAKSINRRGADISNCANGKKLSIGGYIWRYEKLDQIDMSIYKVAKNKLYLKDGYTRQPRKIKNKSNAVNQYTLDGKYLTTFKSIAEAARAISISANGIGYCCRHKLYSSGGYRWEFDIVNNRKNLAA